MLAAALRGECSQRTLLHDEITSIPEGPPGPEGAQGPVGPAGEVSQTALDDAIATTALNP